MKKKLKKRSSGFTLAEVLITLTVIGIVAAITLPSLLVNVNERAWEAQKKALVARLSQAIPQLESLSGYGDEDNDGTISDDELASAAEAFIAEGLSTVYKVANICNKYNLSACGIPTTITALDGSDLTFPTTMEELNSKFGTYEYYDGTDIVYDISSGGGIDMTDAAAFETLNGESIAVFYNPSCGNDQSTTHYVENKMCVNFIYDLNGRKAPNQVGKDIGFITAFYKSSPSVVGPFPYEEDLEDTYPSYSEDGTDAASACANLGDDIRLPSIDEIASMYVNSELLGTYADTITHYWSGSVISAGSEGKAWGLTFTYGYRGPVTPRSDSRNVWCVYK